MATVAIQPFAGPPPLPEDMGYQAGFQAVTWLRLAPWVVEVAGVG